MFARETHVMVKPGKTEEFESFFKKEIAPTVKAQRGFVDAYLLEPTDKSNELISVSLWQSKADSDAYDKSGKFEELSNKAKPIISKAPEVKFYDVKKANI